MIQTLDVKMPKEAEQIDIRMDTQGYLYVTLKDNVSDFAVGMIDEQTLEIFFKADENVPIIMGT